MTTQQVHPIWQACARIMQLTVNPALHTIDQMPDHFKESYILSGYRSPQSSPWQCLASIFFATNETLNFWTHFLPALYFCWQTLLARQLVIEHGDYGTPMFIGMITVCIFPIVSATAHIFNTMSNRSRHICFFLDYASLGLYILGTAIAYRAYVFPGYLLGTVYSQCYLYVSAALSVVALIISCESRFLPPCTAKKVMRMLGFMIPYFFLSYPLMSRIIFCEGQECSWSALPHLKRHFFFAFVSAVLFGTHMPERFYPGRFDIIGHSHQLFHMCSVIGTSEQINHLYADMMERRHNNTAIDTPYTTTFTVTVLLVIILLNILVLSYYILKIYQYVPADEKARQQIEKSQAQNNNELKTLSTTLRQRTHFTGRGDW